jgi:2-keto-3-deoxy-galactonokinase
MDTKSSASTYKRHDRKADDESSVWHYFLVEMPGKENAKCMKCDKVFKTHSGSTGGLLKHLEKHNICLRKKNDATASQSTICTNDAHIDNAASADSTQVAQAQRSKKMKITHYFIDPAENSLEATLSRMTSRDGLPFTIFCSSVDMRQGLIARGFSNVPKSPNTVRTIVMQYSQTVRQVVVNEMMRDMADGKKFSLTLTSGRRSPISGT